MKPQVIKTLIRQNIKFFILLSLIMLVCKKAISQVKIDSAKLPKLEFKNQGEQEDYLDEQMFKNDYKLEHFEKHQLPVISNHNYFQYDKAVIGIELDQELNLILENGLFYPDVMKIAYQYQPAIKIKMNQDSLMAWKRKFSLMDKKKTHHILIRADTLWIANFKEMKLLGTTIHQKRFRFWLFQKGILNPEVCFIELTNKNATKETTIETFIKGAKLTFFKEGWIII